MRAVDSFCPSKTCSLIVQAKTQLYTKWHSPTLINFYHFTLEKSCTDENLEESFLMENPSLAQTVVDIAVATMELLEDLGKKKDVQFIVIFVNMETKY